MPDVLHSAQTPSDGIHTTIWREVADDAARLALTITTADKGKDVYQTDTGIYWKVKLLAGTPVLVQLTETGGGGGGTDDQTAAEVPFTPVGAISDTDTQAAVAGLDTRITTNQNSTNSVATSVTDHLTDTVDAHDATAISFAPGASGIAATEVNAAIIEVLNSTIDPTMGGDISGTVSDAQVDRIQDVVINVTPLVDGHVVTYSSGSGQLGLSAQADELVKVSANDTTGGLLGTKLVAGTNITLTENNDGGNETITIDAAGGGGGTDDQISTEVPHTATGWTSGADVSAQLNEIVANGPLNNIGAASSPASSNDNTEGYSLGSSWITTNGQIFVLKDATTGAAVWDAAEGTVVSPNAPGASDDNTQGHSDGTLWVRINAGVATLYAAASVATGAAVWDQIGAGGGGDPAMGGDVSGTASNATVTAIRGHSVSSTAPVFGQVLQSNGTSYVPQSLGGDVSGRIDDVNVDKIKGVDVALASLIDGHVLTYSTANSRLELQAASGGGGGTDDQTAAEVPYNNAVSGLAATDVQAAIDEVATASGGSSTIEDTITADYDFYMSDPGGNFTGPDQRTSTSKGLSDDWNTDYGLSGSSPNTGVNYPFANGFTCPEGFYLKRAAFAVSASATTTVAVSVMKVDKDLGNSTTTVNNVAAAPASITVGSTSYESGTVIVNTEGPENTAEFDEASVFVPMVRRTGASADIEGRVTLTFARTISVSGGGGGGASASIMPIEFGYRLDPSSTSWKGPSGGEWAGQDVNWGTTYGAHTGVPTGNDGRHGLYVPFNCKVVGVSWSIEMAGSATPGDLKFVLMRARHTNQGAGTYSEDMVVDPVTFSATQFDENIHKSTYGSDFSIVSDGGENLLAGDSLFPMFGASETDTEWYVRGTIIVEQI